jgi:flagellar biosynthesis protein FlhG
MYNNKQGSDLKRFMKRRSFKVIAVCSGKGGVGKTNIAANLAIALGRRGRNTCLLDADLSLANIDVLLGLQPCFNLSHVVRGDVDLASTIIQGPANIRIVPASSGAFCMTDLAPAAQVGIIQAFSELTDKPEIMIVDTASGISPNVARFVQASQHPIVVVRDEPSALTDAYALVKVFSQHYGITHFHIVTNQSRRPKDGRELFAKMLRVTDTYLSVVLRHTGDIPQDDYLVKAVQEQRAVVEAYPRSAAGEAFKALAAKVDALPAAREASGGIEFFFERLLTANAAQARGKVA